MDFNAYIGRQTRVVSKQNVRYSGKMEHIDAVAQKIRVTNVRCYGTEDRPADVFMPPLEHTFNLVEFNVSDLMDLKFEDPAPVPTSSPPEAPTAYPSHIAPMSQQQPQPQQRPPQPAPVSNFSAEKAKPAGVGYNTAAPPKSSQSQQPPQQQYNTSTPTGHPSNPDTLQRAMGAVTPDNGSAPRSNGVSPAPGGGSHTRGGQGRRGRGGGRASGYQQNNRDHHRQPHHIESKVPAADFDFEASNQKFDKTAAARQHSLLAGTTSDSAGGAATPSDTVKMSPLVASGGEGATALEDGEGQTDKAKETIEEKVVYNPSKSFFDNISSDANSKKPGGGRGGPPGERGGSRNANAEAGNAQGSGHGVGRGRGRGGGYGRSRRDEEREKNVATFGEPGGVGLLGPGAYVGGYGGYRGRRRRGGPGGGGRGGRGAGGAGGGGGGAPRVAAA